MNRFLLTMAGVALVATNVGWLAERHRHAETRAELADTRATWAAERAATAEAARLAEAEYRAREQANAEALTAIQRKAEDEKADLRRRAAALADSLRNRPDRPDRPASGGDVPASATDPVACTGAELYRADGEFLAREFERAERLRIEVAECRAAYDAQVTQ